MARISRSCNRPCLSAWQSSKAQLSNIISSAGALTVIGGARTLSALAHVSELLQRAVFFFTAPLMVCLCDRRLLEEGDAGAVYSYREEHGGSLVAVKVRWLAWRCTRFACMALRLIQAHQYVDQIAGCQ